MTHCFISISTIFIFAVFSFGGCHKVESSKDVKDGGGDLDADSDTDGDTDVDSDLDTDTDTDTDTDGDSDTDGDTDTDTDEVSDLEKGYVTVCFAEPGDVTDYTENTWEIKGTVDTIIPVIVMSSIPFPNCEATYLVEVDDGNDKWKVGYRVMSSQSKDISPELSLEIGDSVTLTVVRGSTWGIDHGFSILDNTGLVAAFEEGYQGGEVSGEALDGIVVEVGDKYNAIIETGCGTQHGQKLIFEADSNISLINGDRGSLDVNGYKVTAMNVSTYIYDEVLCTDIWGPKSWAIWR